ncbi:MAG: hypothetical protein IJ856_05900 [Candidatus Methanomethylophilaceae archaeon]|nr:hypothetical protein [Candidatus Methanomethylophilaceae archaeon]
MSDIFFPGKNGKRPVIIEVKSTVDPNKGLMTLAKEALMQVDDRSYAGEPGAFDAVTVGIGIRMEAAEVAFGPMSDTDE